MTTLKQFKNGTAKLGQPIYKVKPYILLSHENLILASGDEEYMKGLGGYFDENVIEIRRSDLHLNNNDKTDYSTRRPWIQVGLHPSSILGNKQTTSIEVRIYETFTGLVQNKESAANTALIVKAVNEYDALNAVAEAFGGDKVAFKTPEQFNALNTLAAVRAQSESNELLVKTLTPD